MPGGSQSFKYDLSFSLDLIPYQTALSDVLALMSVASINKYLDDWLRARECKRISDKD
jgi:hypothetical protein